MEQSLEIAAELRDGESALLSVVVPIYNEEVLLDEFFGTLLNVLDGAGYAYEIIAINDGSVDGSLKTLLEWRLKEPRIKVVDLSRKFGKDVALLAGLDAARGDAVVLMDADLQHPPEVIPQFLAAWEEGYDDVYGTRTGRSGESGLRRLASRGYYRLFNFVSDTKIVAEAGDFRLLSRRAVNALRLFREQQPFLKGLYSWIGFDSKGVLYCQNKRRARNSTWTLGGLLSFGLSGILSFSDRPLRLATILGTLLAGASLGYAA